MVRSFQKQSPPRSPGQVAPFRLPKDQPFEFTAPRGLQDSSSPRLLHPARPEENLENIQKTKCRSIRSCFWGRVSKATVGCDKVPSVAGCPFLAVRRKPSPPLSPARRTGGDAILRDDVRKRAVWHKSTGKRPFGDANRSYRSEYGRLSPLGQPVSYLVARAWSGCYRIEAWRSSLPDCAVPQ